MDVEDPFLKALSPESLAQLIKMEAKQIEKWGLYAMVYTYTNFADTALAMHELTDFDLWIADYRSKRPSRKHGMWQYTNKGKIPGVSGPVDLSHAYWHCCTTASTANVTDSSNWDTSHRTDCGILATCTRPIM